MGGVVTVTLRQLRRVRWAVRGALVLGIAASVAANVLHAEPNAIARVIAGWPPVALLITLELIGRVPVHRRGLAVVRMVATGAIAGIAAWVSYWHMAGVAARYGEDEGAAHLLPLSVDGLIVVASVSLVELGARIRAAGSPPVEAVPGPVNPAAEDQPPTAETPEQSVNGHDPAKARRIGALVDLAQGAEPKAVAERVGVSVQTVQRWADEMAKGSRLPRGGPRRPTTDGDRDE